MNKFRNIKHEGSDAAYVISCCHCGGEWQVDTLKHLKRMCLCKKSPLTLKINPK